MNDEEKYLAWDEMGGEHEFFNTIPKAEKWLSDMFLEDGAYREDFTFCKILKVIEIVNYNITDDISKYKYKSEDEAIKNNDKEALNNEDYWPHSSDIEEIWQHKFIKTKDYE